LRDHLDEIEGLGGRVVVISFAHPDHVARFARHLQHPYLWLSDPDRRSYRALGADRRGLASVAPPRLIWEHIRFALQCKVWHPEQLDLAQMGGDFVFDRAGNLTLRHVSTAPDDRPPVAQLIEAFRRAAAAIAAD
jgi:peroxiredoxin